MIDYYNNTKKKIKQRASTKSTIDSKLRTQTELCEYKLTAKPQRNILATEKVAGNYLTHRRYK